jgi:hypothetical protein
MPSSSVSVRFGLPGRRKLTGAAQNNKNGVRFTYTRLNRDVTVCAQA